MLRSIVSGCYHGIKPAVFRWRTAGTPKYSTLFIPSVRINHGVRETSIPFGCCDSFRNIHRRRTRVLSAGQLETQRKGTVNLQGFQFRVIFLQESFILIGVFVILSYARQNIHGGVI